MALLMLDLTPRFLCHKTRTESNSYTLTVFHLWEKATLSELYVFLSSIQLWILIQRRLWVKMRATVQKLLAVGTSTWKPRRFVAQHLKSVRKPVQLKYHTTRPNYLKKSITPLMILKGQMTTMWSMESWWAALTPPPPLVFEMPPHVYGSCLWYDDGFSRKEKPAGSWGVSNIALWRQLLTKLTAATFILVKQHAHLVGS